MWVILLCPSPCMFSLQEILTGSWELPQYQTSAPSIKSPACVHSYTLCCSQFPAAAPQPEHYWPWRGLERPRWCPADARTGGRHAGLRVGAPPDDSHVDAANRATSACRRCLRAFRAGKLHGATSFYSGMCCAVTFLVFMHSVSALNCVNQI